MKEIAYAGVRKPQASALLTDMYLILQNSTGWSPVSTDVLGNGSYKFALLDDMYPLRSVQARKSADL
jgi:hypothetical protein